MPTSLRQLPCGKKWISMPACVAGFSCPRPAVEGSLAAFGLAGCSRHEAYGLLLAMQPLHNFKVSVRVRGVEFCLWGTSLPENQPEMINACGNRCLHPSASQRLASDLRASLVLAMTYVKEDICLITSLQAQVSFTLRASKFLPADPGIRWHPPVDTCALLTAGAGEVPAAAV